MLSQHCVAPMVRVAFDSNLVLVLTCMPPVGLCCDLRVLSRMCSRMHTRDSGRMFFVVRDWLVGYLCVRRLIMCLPCTVPTATSVMKDALAGTGRYGYLL